MSEEIFENDSAESSGDESSGRKEDAYQQLGLEMGEVIKNLEVGISNINRRRSKNFYQKFMSVLNALAGGNLPSLDPDTADLKSIDNPYSGAEAMNLRARDFLRNRAGVYKRDYDRLIGEFVDKSAALLQIKHEDGAYLNNIMEADNRLNIINDLYNRLRRAYDEEGKIYKDAPRNIVLEILGEISKRIETLSSVFDKNKSNIKALPNSLANGELPDDKEASIIEVCKEAYVLNKALSVFTSRQDYRRQLNKSRVLERPYRATRPPEADSTEDGAREGDPRTTKVRPEVTNYRIDGFISNRDSAIERREDSSWKLTGGGKELIVDIKVVPRSPESYSSSEVAAIKSNPRDFFSQLYDNEDISIPNDDVLLFILRNSKIEALDLPGDEKGLALRIKINSGIKRIVEGLPEGEGVLILSDSGVRGDSIIKQAFNKVMIKKSETATTPLYKTVSPSGKSVEFTASDLVRGMGKIKDPKTGKMFKPKKPKPASLADRVNSKEFGKVRK
jgi:hypothetical protein